MTSAESNPPSSPEDPLIAAILSAVVAIVADEGFEGATIRRVAARAGCSAGAVQKRFPTRAQLLRAAFEQVVATAVERILAHDARAEDSLLERQRLAAVETLPLDPVRRIEGLVWTSYLLRAAIDETLSELPRHVDRAMSAALAGELEAAQATGGLRTGVNPHRLADAVLALVDGIAIRMLYTPSAEHGTLLASLDVGLAALLLPPQRKGA